jgi:glycerol-3-phosphate dehydrogenase (NAD(P)+)
MSPLSRNRRVGEALAQGRRLDEVLVDLVEVAEGVETTRVALDLAARNGIELPIAAQVSQVLFEGKSPELAVAELMARDPKGEAVTATPAEGARRSS